MNWKDIEVSEDNTHFLFQGKPLFTKRFLSVLKFHAPGLAPVQDEKGWFHINENAVPLYNSRFVRAFGYYFNLAAVISNDGWFHLTEKGEPAYKERYEWCGNFQDGLCSVRTMTKEYFHILPWGERAYAESYTYAGDYKDGIACVRNSDGKFKHIDCKGKSINEKVFLDLGVFHKGYATAKDDKGWFHINQRGEPLYDDRYASVEPFYNGFALIEGFDSQKKIINEAGVIVLSLEG